VISGTPNKQQVLEAISKIEGFSPAPRILGKAMALLRDPNSDINDISEIVSSDTALAAQMIRWANSAFYGTGSVSSLDQAVQKIGFRESIRLLNLSVARTMSNRGLDCYGITSEVFWAESLFHGLFLEEMAKATRAVDPGEAHTVGLLRYIGRLAINQSLKDLGFGLFWDGSIPLKAWELESVGLPQAYVGAYLLRAWKFSNQMAEAIECQDEPDRPENPNWFADALWFSGTLFPQGLPIPLTSSDENISAPVIVESSFAHRQGFDTQAIVNLLKTTSKRFQTINKELLR